MTMQTGRGPVIRSQLTRLRWRLFLYVVVTLVCLAFAFPLYWMLLTSLIPGRLAFTFPPHFVPPTLQFSAYEQIIRQHPLLTWLSNSLVVSTGSMSVALALSTLGAYALSKRGWHGRSAIGLGILATQMVPSALLVIPI